MVRAPIIKDDLRFLIFSDLYLKFDEPKTRRRAFTILETAITCFDKKGFEFVTLTMIARECGVTPQLLNHYFDGIDDIRELTLKYIRLIGQKVVVDAINPREPSDLILRKYIEAHRKWAVNFKPHVRVWLGFLNSSSRNSRDREMNSMVVKTGKERLEQMIRMGQANGVYKAADTHEAARLIQTLMLGWLISITTENDDADFDGLTASVIRECLRFVGAQ